MAPEGQDLRREVGVVGLGDDLELAVSPGDDHPPTIADAAILSDNVENRKAIKWRRET